MNVYFDDVKITYTPTNVIQYNEYYPFGLQTSNSWTREDASNNYLYNAGSELNNNTGWYETFFRGYDATLGRFQQVDPYSFSEQATYQYAANNPVYYNDPSGGYHWRNGGSRGPLGLLDERVPDDVGDEGGGGSIMPGSGNHWSDQYRSKYGDYFLMSGAAFESKYGESQYDYREQLIFGEALRQSEPYTGDVWDYRSGIYQYHIVNGTVTGLTTYALYEGGGGEINYYPGQQNVHSDPGDGYGPYRWDYGYQFDKASIMFLQWALGLGPKNRTFNNDRITKAMKDATGVNKARNFFYSEVKAGRKSITDGVSNFRAGFGLKGLWQAGIDPIEQFIGSYRIDITSDGNMLTFVLTNNTSMKSFLYGLGPSWERSSWGPGGNMYQTYTWTESINCSKLSR